MIGKQNQVVIIGDSFNNTLGLVRSLGEAKIDQILILVGKNDRLFIRKSRYLKKNNVYIIDSLLQCMPLLKSLINDKKRQTIICTNDNAAAFVDSNEEFLHRYYNTPMLGKNIGNLMNKAEQCYLAEKCKLDVPKSCIYQVGDEYPDTFKMPLLLKPLYSTEGEKSDIHICETSQELHKCLAANSNCKQFIIQEYIRKDYEINLLGVSTDHGILIPGCIKKIRHYPTIYSPCSYGLYLSVEQLDIDIEPAKKFIKHTGYKGLFSIELLRKDNKNYFMEVNFRNDGLAYTATAAGINLPAIYIHNNRFPKDIKIKETYMMDLSIDFCHVKEGTLSFKQWIHDFYHTGCMLNYNPKDVAPTLYYYWNKIKKRIHI